MSDDQVKLLAAYLNTMAAGAFVAGVITPGATLILTSNPRADAILLFFATTIILSVILHVIAQLVTRELSR